MNTIENLSPLRPLPSRLEYYRAQKSHHQSEIPNHPSHDPIFMAAVAYFTPAAIILAVCFGRILYCKYKFWRGLRRLQWVATLKRIHAIKTNPCHSSRLK